MNKLFTGNTVLTLVACTAFMVLAINQMKHFVKEDSSFEYRITDGEVVLVTDNGGTLVPLEGTDLYKCVEANKFDMLRSGSAGRLKFKDVVSKGTWVRSCWIEPYRGSPQMNHTERLQIGKPI